MNRKEITGTFDAALVMAPSIIVKRTELAGLWVDSALAMPPSIRKGEISGTLGDSALAMTPSINAKRTEINWTLGDSALLLSMRKDRNLQHTGYSWFLSGRSPMDRCAVRRSEK